MLLGPAGGARVLSVAPCVRVDAGTTGPAFVADALAIRSARALHNVRSTFSSSEVRVKRHLLPLLAGALYACAPSAAAPEQSLTEYCAIATRDGLEVWVGDVATICTP